DSVSRIRIGDVWIVYRNCVAGHHGVARVVRGIDVEESISGVVRVESEAKQALLATAAHQVGDIKERGGQDRAVNQDSDLPRLLHDEQPAAAVICVRNRDWRCKAGSHRLDLNRWERPVETVPRIVKSSNRWII